MRFLDIRMYYEDHCKQQQTYPQCNNYIARLIKRLFPDSKKCYVTQNKIKYAAYTNMCAVESPTNDQIHITDESVSVSSDENNNLSIMVPTVHVVGGKPVAMRLLFGRSGLNIFLNDTKIENHVFDIPVHVKYTQSSVNALLLIMKYVVLCKGISIKSADDKQLKRNSIVEEWNFIYDNGTELRARSPNCKCMVAWCAQKEMCSSCVKHFFTTKTSVDDDDNIEEKTVGNVEIPLHEPMEENEINNDDEAMDTDTDQNTMLKMFEGAPNEFHNLLRSQLKNMNSNKDPRYRRWDKSIIKICLSLYCRYMYCLFK